MYVYALPRVPYERTNDEGRASNVQLNGAPAQAAPEPENSPKTQPAERRTHKDEAIWQRLIEVARARFNLAG